jgi:hypothetical protein
VVCRAPSRCGSGKFVINVKRGIRNDSLCAHRLWRDLVFEGNFADSALDSYWHSYITSNAANGWHTESVAATFQIGMKAPSGDAHGQAFG